MNFRLKFFGPLPASEACKALVETMGNGRPEIVEADDADDPMTRRPAGTNRREQAEPRRPPDDPGSADPCRVVFHPPNR